MQTFSTRNWGKYHQSIRCNHCLGKVNLTGIVNMTGTGRPSCWAGINRGKDRSTLTASIRHSWDRGRRTFIFSISPLVLMVVFNKTTPSSFACKAASGYFRFAAMVSNRAFSPPGNCAGTSTIALSYTSSATTGSGSATGYSSSNSAKIESGIALSGYSNLKIRTSVMKS